MTFQHNPDNIRAHKMVAHVAREMAMEVYEYKCLRSNEFYATFPDMDEFVRSVAPTLKEAARKALGEMLAREDVSAIEKQDIYDALILDAVFDKGGYTVQ